MQCPRCEHNNQPQEQFCERCGTRLAFSCAHCGTELSAHANFCSSCGASVGSAARRAAPPVPPATIPTVFGGDRYHVQRFLGEGAKKRVYLAHDARLDRDVAVALIKTEGLDDAGLIRVRREAQAMGRLGDHPHIVTVHDIGDEGGQPYIVSQHMAGGAVDDLLQRAPNHRLPLDHVLRTAEQICQALEHAHARGVVHRDLKPGNVWLTVDGTAKLGDFGLAVAFDRPRLTAAGMMVGTVAYMPPEQALGRPPDDLYSLGAMLYEMVTGRPPFLGDDAVAIISQHINTPPVAPSWHNPEVPRALEALILRLLAKAPEERPESAITVRQALLAIRSTASVVAERVVQEEANPLDRLAAGVFVGREKEMDQLRAGLEETLSGHGQLLMLVGEPGIGKTRTAEELTTYARLRNAQVLWGRCYEGEGAPAFWPWVQVVRAYVHDRDPKTLMSLFRIGRAFLYSQLGRSSEARQEFEQLAASSFRDLPRDGTWLANVGMLSDICAFLGDAPRAAILYELLTPYAARNVMVGVTGCSGPVSRYLGLLADLQFGHHREVELKGLSGRHTVYAVSWE